jgi:hypothetical protein
MLSLVAAAVLAQPWVVYEGGRGPGKGKNIVFLAGDEEYRSEEGLPQLAQILAKRHGFTCTVLFSVNSLGEIDPTVGNNQPGLEALDQADLCIMLLRFRSWPDAQMKHFTDYVRSGKPIIALRTSTHAFNYPADSVSPYRDFANGFGKQVLGETWVSHWGNHGSQATRGVVAARHSILTGVRDVFGDTDVYEASPPDDAQVLLRGQVLSGMSPDSAPATGRKKTAKGQEQDLNDPMMPITWLRGNTLTCTMGAATDLLNEGLRRLLVNSAYWSVGLRVPTKLDVGLVGSYKPSKFGFGGFLKGRKPSDLGG